MRRLLIVGASGMGRETAEYAKDCFPQISWRHGFLDNRPELLNGFESVLPPIVGAAENFQPRAEDLFLVALGEPQMRRKYVEILSARGARFATLIHPSATVLPTARIGEGCIISPQAVISSNVKIGQHCIVNIGASISHDGVLGDYVTFSPGARTTGWCRIADDVALGTNTTVLPRVSLAKGTRVGAGAVVIRDVVDPYQTLVGVPAKIVT